jgi:hypothetical protein
LKRIALLLLLSVIVAPAVAAQDCQSLLREMKLPRKVGTQGKPRVIKWQDVDKTLNDVEKALQGKSCTFTFAQLFRTKHEEALFPLTNSVVRIVPEASFQGMMVRTRAGDELGEYGGSFRYDRSGGGFALSRYSLVSFQYRDSQGEYHTAGSDLLIDQYGVPWEKLQGKVAISTR